jgi:hypothetical protein
MATPRSVNSIPKGSPVASECFQRSTTSAGAEDRGPSPSPSPGAMTEHQGVQVWPVSQFTWRIFSWTTTQETYVFALALAFAFGSGGASIRWPTRLGDPVVSRV